ncbi:GNAT family N-acetyltransferase [Pseudomonas sp. B11D7D]|nr:GNAT family N-acetyltransferase [Pseudomonas sp. B11D7D]QNH06653.1 GNAT family N-acetyltransferase [Pseudomonas sp. B11D7D]
MLIRAVQAEDLQAFSEPCMRSFMTTVAPSLSAEGVASFTQIAATTSLAERLQDDNLMLLAAHEGCPFGYIELKQGQHLAMLFVEPSQQRQGIGRQLLQAALAHVRADTLTVKASLTSVNAYEHYGFVCTGEVGQSAGLVFQPMLLTGLTPPA